MGLCILADNCDEPMYKKLVTPVLVEGNWLPVGKEGGGVVRWASLEHPSTVQDWNFRAPCTHAKMHVIRGVRAWTVAAGEGRGSGSVHDHPSSARDVIVTPSSGSHIAVPLTQQHRSLLPCIAGEKRSQPCNREHSVVVHDHQDVFVLLLQEVVHNRHPH